MGLLGNTEPDNVEKYDGDPFHCRCIGACTCPHCMKRTKRDILLQYDGLAHHETNQPSKRDFYVNEEAAVIPPGIPQFVVPDDFDNMSAGVFGPNWLDPGNRSVIVRGGAYSWEENVNELYVGHWFKIDSRRLHVEGAWEHRETSAGKSQSKALHTFLSGGWFLTYGSVGSFRRLVLQKQYGGPLIVCMNGNWTFEECRLCVRPGPYKPGHYPEAAEWVGGNVLYADRAAEILVSKCYVGFMVHRVKIALYQGICGEAGSRVRIEDTLIEGFVNGVMFSESASATLKRCTLQNNRVGVAINGSAKVTLEKCVVGPNILGGFCSNIGSQAAVLKVDACKVEGDFWYNAHRPGRSHAGCARGGVGGLVSFVVIVCMQYGYHEHAWCMLYVCIYDRKLLCVFVRACMYDCMNVRACMHIPY
jgi:hypothetical protein